MYPNDSAACPGLFTIGHSNHPPERFASLLQKHGIEVVADVRSSPFSKYVPHFNREALTALLERAGLKYLYLGKELGGRPNDHDYYDEGGFVLYSKLAESPLFLAGVRNLETRIQKERLAIMCSEEDPLVCHRHRLIARVLTDRGIGVVHIRGNGELQAVTGSVFEEPIQRSLFDATEDNTWKSLRSVSPRKQPPSFLSAFESTESDVWLTSD